MVVRVPVSGGGGKRNGRHGRHFSDSVSFVKFRGCVLNYMTIVRGNTVLVKFFFFLIGSLINHFL